MDDMIAKRFGIGPGSKPKQHTPGDRGYYSSFEYFNNPDAPPPPVSEGGPTAQQVMQNTGMLDERGFLKSNPNVHSIVAAMYGMGPQKITDKNQSMNPDYAAGARGDTLGGIGNTDAYGNDIIWSNPVGGPLTEGEPFTTPAGTYTVGKNPWGQYVLIPQDGAPGGVGPYITNMTNGSHHVGINPQTGEAWYQQSAGAYDFSGRGSGYTQTPGAPIAPNAPGQPLDPNAPADPPLKGWIETLNDGTLNGLFPNGTSLSTAEAERSTRNSASSGLFSSIQDAEYYQRLLENLGRV